MKHFFNPESDSPQAAKIGGKGHNLSLLRQDHAVPEWVALPVSVFFECLEASGVDSAIRQKLGGLNENNAAQIAEELQTLLSHITLPDEITQELTELIDKRFGAAYVSVRSSAADEDGSRHSFAGIHESFLYIKGAENIICHIRKVWASGYHERALLYRKQNGLALHPVPMAVIIQRMVDAQSSGVVFTADPATQDPHIMIISALYGLGEGLVSAGLDADHIEYDKRTGEAHVIVAAKQTRYAYDGEHGKGLCESPVNVTAQDKPTLSKEQIKRLADAAIRIERRCRRPQDIEFCFDAEGKLYFLQTRDITTVEEYGPAAGNRQIWDNSNIIESYSGVTSPMTFSFIRHAYAVVYHCFSEVMGIPQETIQENQNVYRNMLGLFEGQVYYNLPNWYRLVQQFPGYAYNKTYMESMMGVKDTSDVGKGEQETVGAFRRTFVELPKLLRLITGMLYRFMCLRRSVPAFSRHFDHYYNQWAAMEFSQLSPCELMQIYHDMERRLLRNWKTPIINDFYVMVFYGTLKGCCKKWCGDENGTLQNNLICGEGDIESTAPTRILMKLASEIKATPALEQLFLTLSPRELLEQVPQRKETRAIAETVKQYLKNYGFRCMNELKLEEPSLHDTPEFIYQMIVNYVRMDAGLLDLAAIETREKRIRADAEKRAFSKLSGFKKGMLAFILKHARNGVKNRENMRFARTRIYGLLRQMLHACGATLSKEGIIENPTDIFYLTIDEIWDYVKGTAVTTDLRGLAALRKAEFDGYRALETPPDDHFETYGMAYHRNQFRDLKRRTGNNIEEGTLHGIGCSPGIVEGIARIVRSPRDDVRLNGEILVAARTDPGWVPLYPSVSGLLIERGSILSHSAIVAREMGIPAIVGIPNLLKSVKNGQTLRMDASKGSVFLR